MTEHEIQARQAIRAEIRRLAAGLGNDEEDLDDDDLIPASGLLDSIALLKLVVWWEQHFGIRLREEEITVDNFGTVNLMTAYAISRLS